MFKTRRTKVTNSVVFILFAVITIAINGTVEAAIYNQHLAVPIKSHNDFFGYSVALQKERVIIGAPKNGANKVGSVFVCPITQSGYISDKSCTEYTIDNQIIGNTKYNLFNKDKMFGACVDGGIEKHDDILIGAPKLIEIGPDTNYAIGGVFKLSDIEQNLYQKYPRDLNQDSYIVNNEYQYGYSQFGFSIHFVNSTESIYGTPGYSHWRGNAFLTYLTTPNQVPEARQSHNRYKRALIEQQTMLMRTKPQNSSLAGYSVTSGKFFGHTTYVVGLPNSREGKGEVKLYWNNWRNSIEEEYIQGLTKDYSKVGDYFGSALLAADVNGDGHDDLLVGAPSAWEGDDYDNGKVFVFLSNGVNEFQLRQTLIGKPKSRCGTSLTNLGDITLDKHDSVAVGCPYENGVGAVRVYVWRDSNLHLDSTVSIPEFHSFGYSLSRAVDIDSNNVADLAAGAYASNAMAILKARNVFYYEVKSTYNSLNADNQNKNLDLKICVQIKGHKENSKDEIETQISIEFDDRIIHNFNHYIENVTISQSNSYCKTHQLKLVPNINRLDPLIVIVTLQEKDCYSCPIRSPTFSNVSHEKIPFSFDCKSDICVPNVIMDLQTVKSIVVGEQNKYNLDVLISNDGDPAYVCTLEVIPKKSISIMPINNKRCTNTICEFNRIQGKVKQSYILDFTDWSLYSSSLDYYVDLKCVNSSKYTSLGSIGLSYVSNLGVEGPTLTKQYDSLNVSTFNVESAAIFHVHNEGPSNLEETSYIVSIPRISHELPIVDIFQPESDLCQPVDGAFDVRIEYNHSNTSREPVAAGFGKASTLDNTISCKNSKVDCMQIRCRVISLNKGDTHKIIIPLRVSITQILKNYRSTFSIESIITEENTNKEYISELDVVDSQTKIESVNIWIIIGSIMGALILLAIIIGILKYFQFFNRPTRDLLNEQQDMDGNLEEVEMRQPVINEPETDATNDAEHQKENSIYEK